MFFFQVGLNHLTDGYVRVEEDEPTALEGKVGVFFVRLERPPARRLCSWLPKLNNLLKMMRSQLALTNALGWLLLRFSPRDCSIRSRKYMSLSSAGVEQIPTIDRTHPTGLEWPRRKWDSSKRSANRCCWNRVIPVILSSRLPKKMLVLKWWSWQKRSRKAKLRQLRFLLLWRSWKRRWLNKTLLCFFSPRNFDYHRHGKNINRFFFDDHSAS